MSDDRQRGLYNKYTVKRNDGKKLGACIVLEFKDPSARHAIRAFADAVRADGYNTLANDLLAQCTYHENQPVPTPEPEPECCDQCGASLSYKHHPQCPVLKGKKV